MDKNFKRLFFYIADLKQISGKSERTCSRIMKQIRDYFKLQEHQTVTVFHASEFLGIPLERLKPYMI